MMQGCAFVLVLLAALLTAETAHAQPSPLLETQLIAGKAYLLPEVTVCLTEAAAREVVRLRRAGQFLAFPSGCALRENDVFIPEAKVPGLNAPRMLVHVHALGREVCTERNTNKKVMRDTKIEHYDFIRGV
jgi:hypothetical protein